MICSLGIVPHEPLKQSEELLSQPSVIMFFSCSCDISLHLHKPKALSVSVQKRHSARLWWASGGAHWGAVKDSSRVGRQFLDPIPSEETPGEKLSNLYRDFCRMQLIMPIPHRHTHWPMNRFQTWSEAHGGAGTQATDRPEDQDDGLRHVFWKVPQDCQTWSKNKNLKKKIKNTSSYPAKPTKCFAHLEIPPNSYCRTSLPVRLPRFWSCQDQQVWARGSSPSLDPHFFLVFTARECACIKAEETVFGWYLGGVSSPTAKTTKCQDPAGRPLRAGSRLLPRRPCPAELPLAPSPTQAWWPKDGKALSAEQGGCTFLLP